MKPTFMTHVSYQDFVLKQLQTHFGPGMVIINKDWPLVTKLWIQKHVEIIYSPFSEMITSLHVLVNPNHHLARKSWAISLIEQMPENFREKCFKHGDITNDWFNIIDMIKNCEPENFVEEGIEQILRIDEEKFIHKLFQEKINGQNMFFLVFVFPY